jgi:hypothetical protein
MALLFPTTAIHRFELAKDASLRGNQSENMFMIHPNAADWQISQDDTSLFAKFLNILCNSVNVPPSQTTRRAVEDLLE